MNRAMLDKMMHSPVRNYAIPGLTSWLVGSPSPKGTVRVFECSRDHQEAIIPHSHRFDFQCWVLAGKVRNRVWTKAYSGGDWFTRTDLIFGDMGSYVKGGAEGHRYDFRDAEYAEGQWYSMRANEIHSIYFARGTQVLFFEGPTLSDRSVILEPWENEETVPTFKVEPWMFKRDQADHASDSKE